MIGVDDERLGQVPVAAVERATVGPRLRSELIQRARAHLAAVRAPGRGAHRRRASPDAVGQGRARRCACVVRNPSPRGGGVGRRDLEPWTFGEAPLPEVEALADVLRDLTSTVLALEQPSPELRRLTDEVRAAQARLAAEAPTRSVPAWAPTRRAIGASTSTTRATSVTTTRSFPTTSSMRRRPRARVRSSSPSATKAHPGSSTAASSRCSSIACSSSSTAISASRARPRALPPLPTTDPAARPASSSCATREVDGDRIRSHAELLLDDKVLCEAEMSAVAGNRDALPAVSPRRP